MSKEKASKKLSRRGIDELVEKTSPSDLFALSQAINENVLNALRTNIESAWENAITPPFESLREVEFITLFDDMILRGNIVGYGIPDRDVEITIPIETACDTDLRNKFFGELKEQMSNERTEKEAKEEATKLAKKIALFNSLKEELGNAV
jgi:hypothetical protein